MKDGQGDAAPVLWEPPAHVWLTTAFGRFAQEAGTRAGLTFTTYDELWRWSVDDLDAFWLAVWDFFAVPSVGSRDRVIESRTMPFASWFPDVRMNYAEAMLRLDGREDDDVVVQSRSQTSPDRHLTASELRESVAQVRASLVARGVRKGDCVAVFLPNVPETLVVMLACASIGAVFTSCPPEFGARNVIDRWSQIAPKVVVVVDGYRYGAKEVDRMQVVHEIVSELALEHSVVLLRQLDQSRPIPLGMTAWEEFLVEDPLPLVHERVAFDHPLWILFSSGTTGLPKPIVHGHGGVTLELLKLHGLHHDLSSRDTFFWFSTTGWVMWNLLVSGLLTGSTVVLFDGDPGDENLTSLWRLAADFEVTYFGVSAPFIMQSRKANVIPTAVGDLKSIREVGSTGAPLPVEGFVWLYDELGPKIRVNSLSGGTDVCTAFVGGAPVLPVRAGQIAARQLGCKVEAWSEVGEPLVGQVGEMVVVEPMPSMPVGFWGDDCGARYRAAYFDQWPEVWRHGDWITIAEDGHCAITGRSDATLNRGGVRLGTSEFYRVVEDYEEIDDSLVIHLDSVGGDSGHLILFVVLSSGEQFNLELVARIRADLRSRLSPRHIPDSIVEAPAVPRTLSGKKLEVPVKRILSGVPADRVLDIGSLANPAAVRFFEEFARDQMEEQ